MKQYIQSYPGLKFSKRFNCYHITDFDTPEDIELYSASDVISGTDYKVGILKEINLIIDCVNKKGKEFAVELDRDYTVDRDYALDRERAMMLYHVVSMWEDLHNTTLLDYCNDSAKVSNYRKFLHNVSHGDIVQARDFILDIPNNKVLILDKGPKTTDLTCGVCGNVMVHGGVPDNPNLLDRGCPRCSPYQSTKEYFHRRINEIQIVKGFIEDLEQFGDKRLSIVESLDDVVSYLNEKVTHYDDKIEIMLKQNTEAKMMNVTSLFGK